MTVIKQIQKSEVVRVGRQIPKVIKWNNINMVRNHSFLSGIKEIIDYSEEMDVTRIGVIGDMHSGKSTLSQAIGHAIHVYSKIPYSVRVFFKGDLIKFKETMASLDPTNYVLIFDDASFLKAQATARQINIIEEGVSVIRHMPGGEDVKIILIFNYHYPKALPPFLREAQFKYITSVGDANDTVLSELYGKNNLRLVKQLKIDRKKAIKHKYWLKRIGPKEPIKYNWRNPFIPVLFWNEESLRYMVSPTRFFMQKGDVCSKCEEAIGNNDSEVSIEEFCKIGEEKFTKGNFLAAIKLDLFIEGRTVYGKNVVQALKYLNKARTQKIITLDAIANYYGLQITKTRLRKKVEYL